MRIGIMQGADRAAATLDGISAMAMRAEAAGFDSLWMAHIRGLDAISALTVAGTRTSRIELGTAVTPVQPRHPMALAQQAMTAAQASADRFTLGIGLSHKVVIEDMLGLSYDRPARYMREYLGALLPLLAGEVTRYAGELFRITDLAIDIPGIAPVPTIVAALGPRMLELCGRLTTGTNTWMVGPRTVASHIAPALNAAASAAGRPAPRIIAGYPVVLTNRVEETRARLAEALAIYGQLPSYRAMLDREGVGGPEDLALIGDEATLRAAIAGIRDAGETDFNAAIMAGDDETFDRTFDFVASLQR
ncbi:MAG: TIGR03564 family F420-dependent LLM class oxidoreductase [Gammaproteobacteria bacterium]